MKYKNIYAMNMKELKELYFNCFGIIELNDAINSKYKKSDYINKIKNHLLGD